MPRGTIRSFIALTICIALFPHVGAAQNMSPARARAAITAKRQALRHPAIPSMPAMLPACDPHPGTVAACPMSLEEAVSSGAADLSSKGLITGDEVAITIRNTQAPSKCPVVKVQIFIEFYGADATAGDVQIIKEAIENTWNGRTSSDGRKIEVEVITRMTQSPAPPGTKGFHQVELVNHDVRDVVNGIGTKFDLNRGVGSATWSTGGEDLVYAHEAGHFMGFPDYYDDYDKLPDGTFKSQTDGSILTSSQLAQQLVRNYPNRTLAERQLLLDQLAVGKGVSLTKAGHEGDLMANFVDGKATGAEFDALAAGATGIVLEVDPGTVMLPKNASTQSVVITHTEKIYVEAGQTKTCGGLYASCIDGLKAWSDSGTVFDLAPPLGEWPPDRATRLLAKLARYIDANNQYETSFGAQEAIWRLTDNEHNYLGGGGDFLLQAGIDARDTLFTFPHAVSPDSTRTGTRFTLPSQIVKAAVSPASLLVQPGAQVHWSGKILRPASAEPFYRFSWTLGKPDSSSASLANPDSDTLSFTADKRGVYFPLALINRQGGGSYPSARGGALVAADAMTETFESGSLRRAAPFFWGVSAKVPWVVSDSDSFSGRFAAHSGNHSFAYDSSSDLGVRITIPTPGDISFAYRAGSGIYFFLIDSRVEELYGFSEKGTGWHYATYHLTAGTHDLVWDYSDAEPFDSTNASTMATGAWLDDVFFPSNAILVRTSTDEASAPAGYSLSQNYPNPFTGETGIRYSLPIQQNVTLLLYDRLGREVRRLVDGQFPAGSHSVTLSASGLAPGIYFYRLTAGAFSATRSLVILR